MLDTVKDNEVLGGSESMDATIDATSNLLDERIAEICDWFKKQFSALMN